MLERVVQFCLQLIQDNIVLRSVRSEAHRNNQIRAAKLSDNSVEAVGAGRRTTRAPAAGTAIVTLFDILAFESTAACLALASGKALHLMGVGLLGLGSRDIIRNSVDRPTATVMVCESTYLSNDPLCNR